MDEALKQIIKWNKRVKTRNRVYLCLGALGMGLASSMFYKLGYSNGWTENQRYTRENWPDLYHQMTEDVLKSIKEHNQ